MDLIELKQEAMAIRREIENLSSQLWARVIGQEVEDIWVRNIELRLTLLVVRVEETDRLWALRVARKLGHVYKETSNVLHGRISAAHFNENRVAEWKSDLNRFLKVFNGVR